MQSYHCNHLLSDGATGYTPSQGDDTDWALFSEGLYSGFEQRYRLLCDQIGPVAVLRHVGSLESQVG